ncbi:MAG: GTP-binding protein, partial [Anaerotignaceae bacterium]
NEGITDQDTKIAGIAHERGKAAIVAVNKWDTIEKDDKTMNKYLKDIANELAYMPYAPRVFISAITGQRLPKMLETIKMVHENHALRISTGMLNDVLIEAMAMQQPPSDKGKQLRIYYVTQVSVKPPTFVLFVNDRELMHFSYRRYIENQFREAFGFVGTPIHFIVRERNEK